MSVLYLEHIEHPHPGPMAGRIVFTENHDTVPGDRERRWADALRNAPCKAAAPALKALPLLCVDILL